nr:glycosyltransferase [uncultured Methanoregula sp.]
MTNTDFQILFFTGFYPYSPELVDPMIDPELSHLKLAFRSVTIIPKSLEGKKVLPTHITVDPTLGDFLNSSHKLQSKINTFYRSIGSMEFFRELIKKPRISLRIRSIIRIINYLGIALKTKAWVIKYIENNNVDLDNTIFYTYWLDEITLGICLAKKKYPNIRIISRAHGADLYEERHHLNYIPFRPEIFSNINKLFSVSERGKIYLSSKYPDFESIFAISRLGVPEQFVLSEISDDGIFRIVTCSFLVSVKRIELLIKGLEELGKIRKDQTFEWTHIGDGPLRSELEHIAVLRLPQNVKYSFLGFLLPENVINFYLNNKIDIFINVSSSEGIPVSIMEAQSCGIPVIATNVGGNSEIVSNDNGLLLNGDPTPLEIADAICDFLNNPSVLLKKKILSKENWKSNYNSEKNYQQFAQELKEIGTT